MSFLLINIASATFSIRNYREYNEPTEFSRYGSVEIYDGNLLFPDKKIKTIELNYNTDYCITNCSAEGKTYLLEEGRLIDEVKFRYDLNSENYFYKFHSVFIQDGFIVNKYTEQYCNGTVSLRNSHVCWDVVKEAYSPNWVRYYGEVLKPGEYNWKIEGVKSPYETIDWVGVWDNVEVKEWAIWGGVNYTDGAYTVHVFRDVGTWSFNNSEPTSLNVSVLVVAGGGGASCGGGGAGGLIYNSSYIISAGQNITVKVGAGGIGQTIASPGRNGTNSSFGNLDAMGGGGGSQNGENPQQGGSGGGGGCSGSTAHNGANGYPGQGYPGGRTGNTASPYPSGGGGGAGQMGGNTSAGVSGNGGNGLQYDINGTNVYYAGGGGGGVFFAGTAGTGGLGGGGNGAAASARGSDAINGTGGGGGGGGNGGPGGGHGGSGIVIVRYLTPSSDNTLSLTNVLNTPANNTNSTKAINSFTANLTATNGNLTNTTLYIWNGTTLIITNTTSLTGSSNNTNITISLSDGTYRWNILGCATNSTATLCSFASQNRTILIKVNGPVMAYGSNTPTDGLALTSAFIPVNVTATDIFLKNITSYLFNSTHHLINSSTTTTSPNYINYSGMINGTYYFNASACDTLNNCNVLATRMVTINTNGAGLFYGTGTPTSGSATNNNSFSVNVTAANPSQFVNVTINLYNSSRNLINTTFHTTQPVYLTYTGLSSGIYFFNATGVSSNGNRDSLTTRNITIDVTAPTVSIVYPINNANYSASTWLGQLNYTASDNSALDKCWYSTNGGITNISIACGTNATGLEPYQYSTINNWLVSANDTAGNIGMTKISFYALTNNPYFINLSSNNFSSNNIYLTLFANQSNYQEFGSGMLFFSYNGAILMPFNVVFKLNNYSYSAQCFPNSSVSSNPLICNNTEIIGKNQISGPYTFTWTNLTLRSTIPDGSYIWNATITDAFGNSNTSENRQFLIDTTSPVVSIQYPAGIISDLEAGNNVTLNFSATDTNLDKCWFNYNGVNTTIPCNNNASFLYVLGSNNVTVYANDTVGFTTSAFSSWSPGIVIGNVSWPLTVYETEQGTFNISYTLDNIYSTTARLIYNGTSYLATTNCIGNICSATSTITIPTIVLTAPQNTSFFWAIQATNGTAIINKNTTTYTNLILDSTLNYCTAGNISLNVTFRDELTLAIINAGINVNLDYNLGGTTNQNFGYLNNTQNRSTYSFCINPGTAYFNVTGVINYFKDGYGTRNYVFDNAQLSNITQNLTLYLMNSSFATNVQFRVIDDSNNPVSGAILTIQRWDLTTNSYSAVDIITTDSGGFGVSDLQLNSAWYRYLVSYNGILYLTTTAAVETQTTKILQINFESENPFNQFNTMFGNVTYNNGTRTFTYLFQDTSGALNEGCLKVVKNTPGTTQIISEQCLTASSGTLLYTIPANINGTYIGYGIAKLTSQFNSAESVLDLAYAYLGDLASDIVGDFGFIILVIALITVGAIAASSGSMILGVIGIFAIVFFGSLLGWINIAGSGVLISIGIILLLIGYSAYRRPQ